MNAIVLRAIERTESNAIVYEQDAGCWTGSVYYRGRFLISLSQSSELQCGAAIAGFVLRHFGKFDLRHWVIYGENLSRQVPRKKWGHFASCDRACH